MRSVFQAWPARLLAAAMALALAVSCVVGAYAHAVGHASPGSEHETVVVGTGNHAGHHAASSGPAAQKHRHIGGAHDCDGTGHSPLAPLASLDCCDTICHGGQAILAASLPVPHPTHHAPLIQPAAAFVGAEPGGLDRPPKPFRLA
jgi:hypothetical protein